MKAKIIIKSDLLHFYQNFLIYDPLTIVEHKLSYTMMVIYANKSLKRGDKNLRGLDKFYFQRKDFLLEFFQLGFMNFSVSFL